MSLDDIVPSDLLIRLHDDGETIQFLCRRTPSSSGELTVIHEIRSDAEGSIEEHVGQVVLAFLSAATSSNRFNLDQYRKAGSEFASSLTSTNLNDAERDYENARYLVDRFDESWSLAQLDEVDALLQSASSRGSNGAQQYLKERWPQMRAILVKRLKRGAAG
jgi:hypothetical protein